MTLIETLQDLLAHVQSGHGVAFSSAVSSDEKVAAISAVEQCCGPDAFLEDLEGNIIYTIEELSAEETLEAERQLEAAQESISYNRRRGI